MFSLRSYRGHLLVLALVGVAYCYPSFQQKIPNGEVVPHPCNPNHLWKGVGHIARGGGGTRNDFGLDFASNGKTWTRALCLMDSDGDGKTNGQELGDPDCTWTSGQDPARSTGLSHPGVCEPMDSPQCRDQASFVVCENLEFECSALDEPGVFNYTVRIPRTPVLAKETTYTCMAFEWPQGDYHMVADVPVIDNINVMHHILVYGCDSKADKSSQQMNEPYDCFMSGKAGCNDIIGMWSIGVLGQCIHPDTGFRIGVNAAAYRWAIMEMHWNNPALESGWTDSSGMSFYLTENRRRYDAGMAMIGQQFLLIPPGEERHMETGKVTSTCSRKIMTGPVSIVGVSNHMHYLAAVKSTAAAPKNYEGGISTVSSVSETQEAGLVTSVAINYATKTYIVTTMPLVSSVSETQEAVKSIAGAPMNYEGGISTVSSVSETQGSAAASSLRSRDGRVTYLAKDDTFSYDSPIFYEYDEPIQMNPGDELQIDCHFKSTARTKTTFYGESTNEEMCYAFIMYYPRDNFQRTSLASYIDADPCDSESSVIKGCNFAKLYDFTNQETVQRYMSVMDNCMPGYCKKECKPVVSQLKTENPCFMGSARTLQVHQMQAQTDLQTKYNTLMFWASLDSCDEELLRERIDELVGDGSTNDAATARRSIPLMTSALLLIWISIASWLM